MKAIVKQMVRKGRVAGLGVILLLVVSVFALPFAIASDSFVFSGSINISGLNMTNVSNEFNTDPNIGEDKDDNSGNCCGGNKGKDNKKPVVADKVGNTVVKGVLGRVDTRKIPVKKSVTPEAFVSSVSFDKEVVEEELEVVKEEKEEGELGFPVITYSGHGESVKFVLFEKRSTVVRNKAVDFEISRKIRGRLGVVADLPETSFGLRGFSFDDLDVFVVDSKLTDDAVDYVKGEIVGKASFDFSSDFVTLEVYDQFLGFGFGDVDRKPIREVRQRVPADEFVSEVEDNGIVPAANDLSLYKEESGEENVVDIEKKRAGFWGWFKRIIGFE